MPKGISDHRHAAPVDLTRRRSRLLGPLQAVRAHSTATGSARGVLNVLASYADADTFVVYIGRTRLEEQTGLSRSTLRRAIRRLEDEREIETLVVGDGDRPSSYRIVLSTGGDNSVEGAEPVDNYPRPTTLPEREGVHSDPGGGSPRPRGGVHSEPQPEVTGLDRGEGGRERTCPAHRSVDNPPPCRRCMAARLAADAADEAERRDRLEANRRARREAARRKAEAEAAAAVSPAPAFRAAREQLRRPAATLDPTDPDRIR